MRVHQEVNALDRHIRQPGNERVAVGEPVPHGDGDVIPCFDAGLLGAEEALKKVADWEGLTAASTDLRRRVTRPECPRGANTMKSASVKGLIRSEDVSPWPQPVILPTAKEIDLAQRLAMLTGAASAAAAAMKDSSILRQLGHNLAEIVLGFGYRSGDLPTGQPEMPDQNPEPENGRGE